MNLVTLFLAIMIAAVVWHVTATVLIYRYLRDRGMDVSFVFLRVLILKYVAQYREITKRESGKVGPLFSHWVISINAALVSVLLIVFFR